MFSTKLYASLAVAMLATSVSAVPTDGIVKADCWADMECGGGIVDADFILDPDNGCIQPQDDSLYDEDGNFIGDGPIAFFMGSPAFWCGSRKQAVSDPTDPVEKDQAMQDAIQFCFDIGAASACIWGKCDIEGMCVKRPVVDGDPHFQTWNGEWFDFHGVCDLKLVESKKNDVTINVRTTQRYQYSYVSSAVLELNGETFELGSYGDVIVNGVSIQGDVALPKTLGGAKMMKVVDDEKTHTYSIFLDDDGHSIQLKSFKDMVGVKLYGAATKWEDSVGLMGSSITGQKLARDGKTIIEDNNAYGQEWQVREDEKMLFHAVRSPQAPTQCIIPDTTNTARRLGESLGRKEAEEACKNWGLNKAACIADVMATGDLETAQNWF